MDKEKEKKEDIYVCVVCGKKEKRKGKAKCCDQDMVAEEKGNWNS
jgi:hypothetical protein